MIKGENKRGALITAALSVIIVGLFLFAPMAGAQGETGDSPNVATELGFTAAAEFIYNALTAIGSWFTMMGGFLLDTTLSWFVADMAATTRDFNLTEVINTVWELVRDLFNLLFIFGLIWAGFQLILGIDESGSKRNIGTIIIAALLINFSLYVAQVVVDFGNIAAVEMSGLINAPQGSESMGRPVFNIADSFIAATNLNNLSSSTLSGVAELSTGVIELPSSGIGIGQALVIGLTVALMLIILGFVFAAGAVLMFVRYFYLIFLMMFSPILVLGWILPQFKSESRKWMETLIRQSLMGPAYLFMIYISLLALEAFADNPGDQSITTFLLMSLVVSGFAWASLIVAKKMGAVGASQSMSIGQNWARRARGGVTRFAGGATAGLAARGLRNSLGKRMHEYADSDAAKDKAANSWLGRRQLNLAKRLGDSSFDARQVGGVGKKMGIGEGMKGGYTTKAAEVVKREKKYAESLGVVSDEDPKVKELQSDVDFSEQVVKKQKAEVRKLRKEGAPRVQIEQARAVLEEEEDKLNENKENLQKEKQRRQLGVVSKVGESAYLSQVVKDKKDEMKRNMDNYANSRKKYAESKNESDKANMESFQRAVMENKKELDDLEKKRDQSMGGYANTVENIGGIRNFFMGRNKAQNEEAAKKIREEFKKKIKSKDKKDKEEKGDSTDGDKKEDE